MKTKVVLIYLGHPAHFHLFHVIIRRLLSDSVKVVILIKSKDVLEQLLIRADLPYINILPEKTGNKYLDFAKRLFVLTKVILRHKPDLLMGSAAELGIMGRIFRIPSYIFFEDDFEVVPQFARIAGPSATRLVCPDCCSAWKWNDKKIGYRSYHELAYLHPDVFTPDPEKVKDIFDLNERNFILRFAELTAYHDVGKSGISTHIAEKLIRILEPYGKVFITSERPLEPEFEKYRISIDPSNIHHALYYADMYIGDSQTMTAEAAVLGTPSIRFNDFVGKLSYLEELEHKYHLTVGIETSDLDKLFQTVTVILKLENVKQLWQDKRAEMLKECINLSDFIYKLVGESLSKKG